MCSEKSIQFTRRVTANNFDFLIDSISYFGNFSADFISHNSEILNWKLLSANENQVWNYNLLVKYRDRLDWKLMSENLKIPWNEFIIDEFMDELDWGNSKDNYSFGISHNPALPFSADFIRRYQDKWDWTWLSGNKGIPLSEPLIKEFLDKWNWELLSTNSSLPLSRGFLQKYSRKLDWKTLSGNKSLKLTEDLLENFVDHWEWERLSANEAFVLSEEIILKFSHKIAWHKILANNTLDNTLYAKFCAKIEWEPFSFISNRLIFSESFLKRFKEDIDFQTCHFNLPTINIPFIKQWQDQLDWENLSITDSVFSEDVFEEYNDLWHWIKLSSNESLPWSLNFLEMHKDKFFWRTKVDINAFGIAHYHGLSTNPKVFQLLFSGLDESNIEDLLQNATEPFDSFPRLDNKSYKNFYPHNQPESNDDYSDYQEEYHETIFDNPYYDPELDFDQQGQDFDF